jgi:hypothetical protein
MITRALRAEGDSATRISLILVAVAVFGLAVAVVVPSIAA